MYIIIVTQIAQLVKRAYKHFVEMTRIKIQKPVAPQRVFCKKL